jgi:hypothetical protein
MIGRLLNIAKGNAMFDESVGESSFTNAANKVVFAHQDGTYNTKGSYVLRDSNYRRQLRETGVREEATAYRDAYDNEWLTKNFLLNSPAFEAIADNLLFQRIDGMRSVETNSLGRVITQEFRDQKEGVTYGDYSSREFIVNLMNMYVSYSQTQRGTNGQNILTAPHLIRVLEASKTADTINLPVNLDVYSKGSVTAKAVNQLFDEMTKEFRRIARVQSEINNPEIAKVELYHTGSMDDNGKVTKGYRGLQFTDNMTPLIGKGLAAQFERKARAGEQLTDAEVAQAKAAIGESMNNLVQGSLDTMVKEGILKKNPNGTYSNVLLHGSFFAGNTAIHLAPVKTSRSVCR